jgi:hypothetical protein
MHSHCGPRSPSLQLHSAPARGVIATSRTDTRNIQRQSGEYRPPGRVWSGPVTRLADSSIIHKLFAANIASRAPGPEPKSKEILFHSILGLRNRSLIGQFTMEFWPGWTFEEGQLLNMFGSSLFRRKASV